MPKPHINIGVIGASSGLTVAERLILRGALSATAPIAAPAPETAAFLKDVRTTLDIHSGRVDPSRTEDEIAAEHP